MADSWTSWGRGTVISHTLNKLHNISFTSRRPARSREWQLVQSALMRHAPQLSLFSVKDLGTSVHKPRLASLQRLGALPDAAREWESEKAKVKTMRAPKDVWVLSARSKRVLRSCPVSQTYIAVVRRQQPMQNNSQTKFKRRTTLVTFRSNIAMLGDSKLQGPHYWAAQTTA